MGGQLQHRTDAEDVDAPIAALPRRADAVIARAPVEGVADDEEARAAERHLLPPDADAEPVRPAGEDRADVDEELPDVPVGLVVGRRRQLVRRLEERDLAEDAEAVADMQVRVRHDAIEHVRVVDGPAEAETRRVGALVAHPKIAAEGQRRIAAELDQLQAVPRARRRPVLAQEAVVLGAALGLVPDRRRLRSRIGRERRGRGGRREGGRQDHRQASGAVAHRPGLPVPMVRRLARAPAGALARGTVRAPPTDSDAAAPRALHLRFVTAAK